MTAIWPGSRIPYFGINGKPIIGGKLRFYDVSTTTPQTVYQDASLSIPYAQPIQSDARGMFPAIFLNPDPGAYRQRMVESDDTLVFDDDGISVFQSATYEPPDAGETSITLLARTGDLKLYYGTAAPSGWVRCGGRTIGSAGSGATERANADCEDLFLHLWSVDDTLAVSGGRGGSAAGDWASDKTIALPDYRERVPIGLATMGASAAGRIANSLVDGSETSSDLGATAGASTVTLNIDQMPAHNHAASFSGNALPGHSHVLSTSGSSHGLNGRVPTNLLGSDGDNFNESTVNSKGTTSVSAGTPSGSVSVSNRGGGQAHANLQPGMFQLVLIKL